MTIRKLIILILLAAVIISSGCTTEHENGVSPSITPTLTPAPPALPDPIPPTSQPDDTIKIDFFWYDYYDNRLASIRNAVEEQLSDLGDSINYTMHDCMNDQETQDELIHFSIERGTDLLIVSIVNTMNENVAISIVNIAREAKVPIIFFEREVSNASINSYDNCILVGIDSDNWGYMQGQAIAEFLLAGDNFSRYDLDDDGEIKYIMLRGESDNFAFPRTLYSVSEANSLLGAIGFKLMPSIANEVSTFFDDDGISNFFLPANWQASIATELMSTALTEHSLVDGDVELIISNNDDMAIGAILALNEHGFNMGSSDNYIPVFGMGGTDVAIEAINTGKMTATIRQDTEAMATCIIALINNIANGDDLLANTDGFIFDPGVAKIRIPHMIVGLET